MFQRDSHVTLWLSRFHLRCLEQPEQAKYPFGTICNLANYGPVQGNNLLQFLASSPTIYLTTPHSFSSSTLGISSSKNNAASIISRSQHHITQGMFQLPKNTVTFIETGNPCLFFWQDYKTKQSKEYFYYLYQSQQNTDVTSTSTPTKTLTSAPQFKIDISWRLGGNGQLSCICYSGGSSMYKRLSSPGQVVDRN